MRAWDILFSCLFYPQFLRVHPKFLRAYDIMSTPWAHLELLASAPNTYPGLLDVSGNGQAHPTLAWALAVPSAWMPLPQDPSFSDASAPLSDGFLTFHMAQPSPPHACLSPPPLCSLHCPITTWQWCSFISFCLCLLPLEWKPHGGKGYSFCLLLYLQGPGRVHSGC